MKISLGRLRKLIREAMHDTVMAPTDPVEASPESMRTASHPSLGGQRSPLDTKVSQVMKIMAKQGKHVDGAQVKKLLSTVDPQRLLVMPAEQVAQQVAKKLAA